MTVNYYQSLTQLKSLKTDVRSGGAVAIKGILFEMYDLPLGINNFIFYGVTSDWYGVSSDLVFGNISLEIIKNNRIGFAYKLMNSNANNKNSIDAYNYNYSIFGQGKLFQSIEYFIEYGRAISWVKNQKKYNNYGVICNTSITIPAIFFFDSIIAGVNYYYIEPDYIGSYSGVYHTRLPYSFPNVWYSVNPQPDQGVTYNNRKGIDMKLGFEFSFLSCSFSLGQSTTIKPTEAGK